MKKFMMGIALATLFATPALADDQAGFNMGITGYLKQYLVYADQNGPGGNTLRKIDMVRDTEVHFVGENKLENGMTVGVDVGADGDHSGGFDVTDSFIFFSGDFGKFNVGATDGAAYLLQVQAPSVDANYDGQEQYYNPFNYGVTGIGELSDIEFDYDQDVTNAADKITYFTPMFGGFQAAASWTPEVRTASRGLNGVDDATGLGDAIDLALRYNNTTSWGDYSVGGAYSTVKSRQLWNVGADANIGAFGIGAVYTHDDQDEGAATGATGQHQWIAGVDYTIGRYKLGASYLNQNNEFGTDDIDTDRYTAGVTYNVGPGIDFRGLVTYIDHSVDAGLGSDVDATAAMLGTSITF